MRTKHLSDDAFEVWVDGADQLRTHSVQAAFRMGWNAGQNYEAEHCPHANSVDALSAELFAAKQRDNTLGGIIEQRDDKIADLETEVSDLETIAQAVEAHCRPHDGEEAYGWLMAQAVKALREERDRLLTMVVKTGVVERFAQCPCCFAERTNGERHEDDCDLLAAVVGDPEDDHSIGRAPEEWGPDSAAQELERGPR